MPFLTSVAGALDFNIYIPVEFLCGWNSAAENIKQDYAHMNGCMFGILITNLSLAGPTRVIRTLGAATDTGGWAEGSSPSSKETTSLTGLERVIQVCSLMNLPCMMLNENETATWEDC